MKFLSIGCLLGGPFVSFVRSSRSFVSFVRLVRSSRSFVRLVRSSRSFVRSSRSFVPFVRSSRSFVRSSRPVRRPETRSPGTHRGCILRRPWISIYCPTVSALVLLAINRSSRIIALH